MRVWCASVALALALAGCASNPPLPARATLPAAARSEPRQYVVVTVRNPVAPAPMRAASTLRGYDGAGQYLAGSRARADGRALAAEYRLEEVSSWPIALLGVHCLVYGLPAGAVPAEVIAALGRDRRVESVQPLQAFATESAAYNDPYAELQKNVAQMSVPEAHSLSRGAGVRVAVIDTGVDTAHPDLRPHSTSSRNFVDTDPAGFLTDAHGTAVAGVIAAVPNNGVGIVGVAPDVELLAYKACWRMAATGMAAVCNTFTLAQALAAAIDARADVINLSLGGPSDPLLTRLVRRGLEAGAIVVGAVPRDGRRDSFPVGIEGVIAVDTLDAAGAGRGEVRAPGRDVLSLAPEGHYDFYSGSSLATAEVSGLVALLRADHPHLTAREAEALLSQSAAGGATGAPNACAALASLLHRAPCGIAAAHAGPAAGSALESSTTTTRGRGI